jgi:hypothetical protein
MSSLYSRTSAILALTPAATMVGKEGYGCTFSGDTATISSSASTICTGLILEGAATTGKASIGIIGALGGPVRVCLGGTVTKGAALVQHTDGTWITDPGSGARVKSFICLESGVAGQLVEAANLSPITLS